MFFSRSAFEIDPRTTSADELRQYRLIDIRDPQTAAQEPITFMPSENIPFEQFYYGIPQHLKPDEPLLVSCYHGNTSLMVVNSLRANGFSHAYSLRGGYETIREL